MELSELIKLAESNDGTIENQTFENINWDFNTINVYPQRKSFNFYDCTFLGNFNISNCQDDMINSVFFNDCKFLSRTIRFFSSKLRDLEFDNCNFENIRLSEVESQFLHFTDCSINKTLRIYNCVLQYLNVDIDSKNSIKEIHIDSENIQKCKIISDDSIKSILLNSFNSASLKGTFKKIEIQSGTFSSLTIEGSDALKEHSIQTLIINQCINNESITVSNLEINEFNYNSCLNIGGIVRLTNLRIKSAEFKDLTIHKFYWDQIHFLYYLSIKRCDLFGLKSSYIKWLKGHKLSNSSLDKKIIKKNQTNESEFLFNLQELQYERDTYRQLKAASFANHNNVEALAFYRNEMRLYWKEIRINGGVGLQDRILVFLNRWVSDFGQSWGLPLMWLAIFHTLLYFCIIDFNFTFDCDAFKAGGGQFFELLNPVHKTPDYIKGFYIGVELLMRILDGFFIYHFIRATRKFAKI